jgi:tetratricopeptide (TPR) repeat protein
LANFQNEREQLAQLEWLFQEKKFAEGVDQIELALRQFPASFQLKFLKFRFLKELQRTGEALTLLREMHAMFGDNILVLKELAGLHFQQQQFPESLLYYKKLLFLDSFNSRAQERVRHLQGILESGVAEQLADTQVELRADAGQGPPRAPAAAPPPPKPSAPAPAGEVPLQITFDAIGGSTPEPEEAASAPPPGEDVHFQTESAAELYFKQGLYREALAIYKSLFEKTGRTDYFLKIKAILLLLRTDQGNQVIERLQKFLHLIQQRGRQIVQNDI